MKVYFKKTLSVFLSLLMLFTSVAVMGTSTASAETVSATISGYSGTAAAEYAKTYWQNYNSSQWGNYNSYGGDCAAFVSQCLYAGGIPMTSGWHWYHLSRQRTDSWTRVKLLFDYLVSCGGTEIDNPSASDISVGDVLIYDWTGDGDWEHSAICADKVNGVPYIACHRNDRYTDNWSLGAAEIKLVKLYGTTCSPNQLKPYDIYKVTAASGLRVRSEASTSSGTLASVETECFVHVTETASGSGYTWGKINYKGTIGWVCLAYTQYIGHVGVDAISHLMGEWYTVKEATCSADGEQKRVCSRCGYTETRSVKGTSHTPGAAATCTTPQVCTKCNETIVPALGHDWSDWVTTGTEICGQNVTQTKTCKRCGKTETREIPVEHNWGDWIVVTAATCTTTGTQKRTCSRCGESQVETIEALGHDMGEWYVVTEPSLGSAGTRRRDCSRCDKYETESFTDKWITEDELPSYNTWCVKDKKTQYQYQYRTVTKNILSGRPSTSDIKGYASVVSNGSTQVSSSSVDTWTSTLPSTSYSDTIAYFYAPTAISQLYYHFFVRAGGYLKISKCYSGMVNNSYENGNGDLGSYVNNIQYHAFHASSNPGSGTIVEETRSAYHDSGCVCKNNYGIDTSRAAIQYHGSGSAGAWNTAFGTVYDTTGDTSEFGSSNYWYTDGVTFYKYTKKGIQYNYTGYGAWQTSDWSDTLPTSSDTKEIGTYITRTVYNVDCNHLFAENPKEDVAATCTQPGHVTLHCNRCGYEPITVIPALGHDMGEWYVYKAPTCTEKGVEKCDCSRGDYSETREIEATGHDMGEWYVYKAPTCTEKGVEKRDCSCGDYSETRDIDALGHTYTAEVVAPTCTEKGYTVHKCERCGDTYIDSYTEALGHDLGEWTISKEATCENDGEEERKCSRCDYCEKRSTGKGTHDFDVVVTDATCTFGGFTTYTCKKCGFTYTADFTDSLGHDMGEWSLVKDATCTEDGYSHRLCSRCGYEETKIIEATGHDYEKTVTQSTCTENGITTYVCSKCGDTYTEGETNPLGHDMGEWYVVEGKAATCTLPGLMRRDCSRGDYCETKTIDALGHDYKATVTNPTCTENGYTKYVCSRCGDVTYGDETDALGHDMCEWYAVTNPTCTEKGLEQRDCSRNDHTETRETAALGHDYKATVIAPTCTEKGYTLHVCSRCGDTYKDSCTEPTDHSFDKWYTVKNATCTEKGLEQRDCLKGDFSETRETDALGHDYSETVIAPTCTEKGYTLHVCSRCGDTFKDNYTDALGHDIGKWYTVIPATYDSKGLERRDCSRGDYFEEREIPVLEKTTFNATFVADGKTVAVVQFAKGTKTITEPSVPGKDRYTGKWEEYALSDGDITINAVYTLIKTDDIAHIDTEKTASYDPVTGTVSIHLDASSKAKTVITTTSEAVPLDIVLVIDQSGSMRYTLGGSVTKVEALKSAANAFIEQVYENAVSNNVDHRISVVGFGIGSQVSGYTPFYNTEILSGPNGAVNYGDIKPSDYTSSLVSVNVDGSVNKTLTDAVDSIDANGATAADLGLEMAKGVFANTDSAGRERIVVFMTDGSPTYGSSFSTQVANTAIANSKYLKNTYNASVYSLGVLSDEDKATDYVNTFLNYVSSDYPDASSMSNGGKAASDAFSINVSNTDRLSDVFSEIATDTVTHTTDFDDVTIIDTISKYFTMTSVQETAFRKAVIEKYNTDNSAVTVERNQDGTTTIKVEGIHPRETADSDGNVIYKAELDLSVTANENASEAGLYYTNTDDAGVMLGDGKGYEEVFASPSVKIDEAENTAIFSINGIPYQIVRVSTGTKISAPEFTLGTGWTFSGWNIPDDYTLNENGVTFNAEMTIPERTVTWHIGEKTTVQKYKAGDFIQAPEVNSTSDSNTFLGWNGDVPVTMPDKDLEYTAVFGAHTHTFTAFTEKEATCETDGIIRYTCSCGYSYTETVPATGHNFIAVTSPTDTTKSHCTFVCSKCGKSYDYALNYYVSSSTGARNRVVYQFSLSDSSLETGFEPDGKITIRIPLSEIQSGANSVKVQRKNDDGTKTDVESYIEDGFLVIVTDHFSPYEIDFTYECQTDGNHTDADGDGICDICGTQITSEEKPEQEGEKCPYCGKVHSNDFWGKLAALIHIILYFFTKLFAAK